MLNACKMTVKTHIECIKSQYKKFEEKNIEVDPVVTHPLLLECKDFAS